MWNIFKRRTQGHRSFCVIEGVTSPAHAPNDIESRLLQREAFYIHHLKTIIPTGLNSHLDLSPYIQRLFNKINKS